ncbi:hypothetical protein M3Y97_00334100 [Aphelenchoides bicaudatus]|nr:hypothetical protein M3Y97_00334100 [Aphelenchoides bicaudatus]
MDNSLENEQVEAVRQKRKQRIMANSQRRMNAILNMNGEKRQAPCVDGIGSSNSSNNSDTQSPISRVPSQPKIKEPLDFEDDDTFPIKQNKLISTQPKYMEFIDKQRFLIALLIGVLLASLTLLFDQIGNLILLHVVAYFKL